MRLQHLPIAAVFLFVVGCPEKNGEPSEDFTQGHAAFSKLYAEKLDDAYTDSQIEEIEQKLKRVSPKSIDFTRAQALLQRIREGRSEAKKREDERSKLLTPPPFQSSGSVRTSPSSLDEAPQGPADAGSPVPSIGMSLAEFTSRFGSCYREWESVIYGNKGSMRSWQLFETQTCIEQNAGMRGKVLIGDSSKLIDILDKTVLKRDPDAGTK
jgi:hypothetical protein